MTNDQHIQSGIVTVAISTMGHRISNIKLPNEAPNFRYKILVQGAVPSDVSFQRADVDVKELSSIGLSKSRNSALEFCDTEFLLFADDDHVLLPDNISRLAEVLVEKGRLGFVVGYRARTEQAEAPKAITKLNQLNTGKHCAPEILIRAQDVNALHIKFDPDFGAGAIHETGEDYIFLCDMLKKGLTGEYHPILTGYHLGTSTGDIWDDPQLMKARREVISRVFGKLAATVSFAYAIRHYRRFSSTKDLKSFVVGYQ